MRVPLVVVVAIVAAGLTVMAAPAPLRVVPTVDLARYAGTWYEIARLPNRFQTKCAGEVVAAYARRPDGRITVTNRCRTTGSETTVATGIARRVDRRHHPSSRCVSRRRFSASCRRCGATIKSSRSTRATSMPWSARRPRLPLGAVADAADGPGALPPSPRRREEPGLRRREGRGDETAGTRLVAA